MAANARGPDAPFLPADGSGGPASIVLQPQSDGPTEEWGTRVVSAGWAVDLDAAILVDRMSVAWLGHTRGSLMEGQRPDGGGAQKPLSKRALSNPDRDSPHRGFNSGELADGLRRTPITSDGRTATCRCLPPPSRNAYVGKELRRGVVLLTGAGAAGVAAVEAARAVALPMAEGREVGIDRAERTAREVSK